MSADSQKPIVLSMMMCQQFYRDTSSRNLSLLGCFNHIRASEFPARHPGMDIYLAITDYSGPVTIKVLVIDRDEERQPVATGEVTVQIPNPRDVQDFTISFRELTFPSPGEYRVQAFCNKEFLIERRLNVTLSAPKPKE
jgi:hypothetical protein